MCIHICIHIYISAYFLMYTPTHTYTCNCTCTPYMYTHINKRKLYTYIYTCLHTCMPAYIYIYREVLLHPIYVCMYVPVHVNDSAFICVDTSLSQLPTATQLAIGLQPLSQTSPSAEALQREPGASQLHRWLGGAFCEQQPCQTSAGIGTPF